MNSMERQSRLAGLMGRRDTWFTILAVLAVPLVYAIIMLTPSWGPYDNLSNLPVAVVNKDLGTVTDGKKINVGKDLVAKLEEGKDLGWDFVSSEEGTKGLKDNKYYMLIEIPEDFSQKVSTVMAENPEKPELRYIQNEGLHFIAATATKTAARQIREQLSDQITATYTRTVFDKLGDVKEGFKSGADGSTKLYEGSVKLHEGTGTLLNSLTGKAGDIKKLSDGAKQVQEGNGKLYNTMNGKTGDIAKLADGSRKLEDGSGLLLSKLDGNKGKIKQLADGGKALHAGANELKAGTANMLNGLKTAQTGVNALNKGADELVDGSGRLAGGLGELGTKTPELADGSKQVYEGIKQMERQLPILALNPDFQRLKEGARLVAEGNGRLNTAVKEQLQPGANKLHAGIKNSLKPGTQKLATGLNTQIIPGQEKITAGAARLADGANAMKEGTGTVYNSWGAITDGVSTINNGLTQVRQGNEKVYTGWQTAVSGAGQLADGSRKVADGTQTVHTGWGTMTEGVTKLNDGTGQVKDGSLKLSDGLKGGADQMAAVNASDKTMDMFASPVELKDSKINPYPFYRYANAPYILSLALFVGVLLMTMVVGVKKPADVEMSGFRWYLQRYGLLAILVTGQAVLLSVFTLFNINSGILNGGSFILFAIFASITFMTIVFFLAMLAGNLGLFIAFAFLVVQLSTTGSALPIEMLPANLRALSEYLPLTYSIAGFRSIISLNDFGMLMASGFKLLLFLLLFAGMAVVLSFVTGRKANHDGNLTA